MAGTRTVETRTAIRNASDFGRVAVMYGGSSSERAVSLDTGTAVLRALRGRGVDAHGWDPAEQSMQDFAGDNFDRVWIALHGPGGEDGALQGLLQWLNMPFTGSGVLASSLAMDKVRSKHLFRALALPTPEYRVVRGPDDARLALRALGLPLILKPAGQGSSVGMSKIFDAAELDAALELALSFEPTVLAERCIVGDELTVGILQGEALPSIRIETPHAFYDYSAKYESERTRYICPGTRSETGERELRRAALAAFSELGCSGWGRVDFMTGADGVPQILEVNTVPGMTSHSLVPMAAQQAGIDFPELCWRILETSISVAGVAPAGSRDESREVANGA
ncbi:MAG TPA: D-alanine--D-alanine ligase [Woeseiaceae bacterium]|nr:D-alanine--D-alanine ligase [Woeseiaceae bacterium]